ncbi:MAG: nucleoside hydrolase [Polyangiaceae bacterium]|nr:nucleoside hydrolase [Polyangiaceae bacterium]
MNQTSGNTASSEDVLPSIFDMDIGSDPDDTFVATLVLHSPEKFRPALLLTNDETPTAGRARFLLQLVQESNVKVRIAAGLPSQKQRDRCLVEHAGLCAGENTFEKDATAALIGVLEAHSRVRYFSLGALTNLNAALSKRPDLAERVELFQMGPALLGAYHRDRPQYNARLDPLAFKSVVTRVSMPRFVMSHSTWGTHLTSTRQMLGVYLDDPLTTELRALSPVARLFVKHLEAWVDTGMPCTILHDPLTVLSAYFPNVVDTAAVQLVVHDSGWTSLNKPSHEELRALLPGRARVIERHLTSPFVDHEGATITCSMSLDTNDAAARRVIAANLFGERGAGVAQAWGAHNGSRNE